MEHVNLLPLLLINDYLNLGVLIFAYLDPGSGSFILQLIIAGFAGLMFVLRGYWSRLLGLFKNRPPKRETRSNDTNESDQ